MFWDDVSPWAQISTSSPAGQAEDVTAGGLGQVGIKRVASDLTPDSPMFWAAVLIAGTLGLIGASTHLRIGPLKASASI